MNIKKFKGSSIKQATDRMKKEFGSDAIILDTKKVKTGGILSFINAEEYVITAAIENEVLSKNNTYSPNSLMQNNKRPSMVNPSTEKISLANKSSDTVEELKNVATVFQKKQNNSYTVTPLSVSSDYLDSIKIKEEFDGIKLTLNSIVNHLKYSRLPALPDNLNSIYQNLIEQGVHEKLATDIVQNVYGELSGEELMSETVVEEALLKRIAQTIRTKNSSTKPNTKPQVIALVGPTGVGKTTTIAKLAANYKILQGQNVALISVDTYRIGAIEQLKTFAAIADIPIEIVYRASEISKALRKFNDKDVVFFDTVGRNQKNIKEINDLAKLVNAAHPDEVHLVISAVTDKLTVNQIVANYKALNPSMLILSKLDEATGVGSILNIANSYELPISYLTTGQTVPDDIMEADAKQMANTILKGILENA